MSSYRICVFICLVVLLAADTVTAPVRAQQRFADLPAAEAYRACVQFVRRNPEDGFEAAIAWRDEGGGPPALHCTAMALIGLGQFADAAQRLETLARGMTGFSAAERAAVLAQSGNAWQRAGQLDQSYATLSTAITLAPDNAEFYIDRGEVSATAGDYWEAIDDFNAALDRNPDSVDALIFRGTAYRLLEATELAREDLDAALARDIDNPDALVELGAIEQQEGRTDAARQLWLRAISVAPASPAAEAARRWLERIDVKVD